MDRFIPTAFFVLAALPLLQASAAKQTARSMSGRVVRPWSRDENLERAKGFEPSTPTLASLGILSLSRCH
jgi:hypothetical protein